MALLLIGPVLEHSEGPLFVMRGAENNASRVSALRRSRRTDIARRGPRRAASEVRGLLLWPLLRLVALRARHASRCPS
jgi:hypothetical protein